MTPEQRHRNGVFAREARERGLPAECFYADLHRCGTGMDGRPTADHPIPKQTLKLNWRRAHSRARPNKLPEAIRLLRDIELDELIADPDNGLIVCAKANTDLAAGILRPPRDRLPLHVEQFATRFGLEWYLDEHYGRRREAA